MSARATAAFEAERGRLTALANRMLGSVADAEDVVQEAFLRWQGADGDIRNDGAFLTTIVTRLALDELKSARRRRAGYVGPWLPEPWIEPSEETPNAEDRLAQRGDLSLAFLLCLECLSPRERAAFLLHDAFDLSFAEVADHLGTSEAAARQLAARARRRLGAHKDVPGTPTPEAVRLAEAFVAAAMQADLAAIAPLLRADVTFISDGGARGRAALRPIQGREAVADLMERLLWRKPELARPLWLRLARVNGLPGLVARDAEGAPYVQAIGAAQDGIGAIYVMRNPEKLERLKAFEAA